MSTFYIFHLNRSAKLLTGMGFIQQQMLVFFDARTWANGKDDVERSWVMVSTKLRTLSKLCKCWWKGNLFRVGSRLQKNMLLFFLLLVHFN